MEPHDRTRPTMNVLPFSLDGLMGGIFRSSSDSHNTVAPDTAAAANATDACTLRLRSQAEFLMTGVVPVPAQPEVACSTCLEVLTDYAVKMMKCGHMFHCVCILAWFRSRNMRRGACPNCRTELFEPVPLTSEDVSDTPRSGERGGTVTPLQSERMPMASRPLTMANTWGQSSAAANSVDPRETNRVLSSSRRFLAEAQAGRVMGPSPLPQGPSIELHDDRNEEMQDWLRQEAIIEDVSGRARLQDALEMQAPWLPRLDALLPTVVRDIFAPIPTEVMERLSRRGDIEEDLRRRFESELILRRAESNTQVRASSLVPRTTVESERPSVHVSSQIQEQRAQHNPEAGIMSRQARLSAARANHTQHLRNASSLSGRQNERVETLAQLQRRRELRRHRHEIERTRMQISLASTRAEGATMAGHVRSTPSTSRTGSGPVSEPVRSPLDDRRRRLFPH